MEKSLKEKFNNLQRLIQNLGSLVTAYSGGVDSTLLLRAAHEVLGDDAVAVISRSPLHSACEYKEAQRMAQKIGAQLITINTNELATPEFIQNPPDRCYYCKKKLFTEILTVAQKRGISIVADGTNFDDRNDYRPGIKALLELGIRSPLKEVRMTKADIRSISRALGLSSWDKPSYSCLASRFPYGEGITFSKLQKVEKAEAYLYQQGFKEVRVRVHGGLVRIEVSPQELSRFGRNGLRLDVLNRLKKMGFTYISLDLEGYRSGSMNEVLYPAKKGEEPTNLVATRQKIS